MAPPLKPAEFAAALAAIGGFEQQPAIAVAVSGGPDSMALAILAERWARQRGGSAWGLIVDHGLRAESGAEASLVASWLAARGIPHHVLAWTGRKPTSGIQEAARAARYRLLGEWCRGHGVLHLLTAHHRDDQVESFLIRQRASSGPDGLAGMSAVRELPGLRLLRPLLAVSKARLGALLTAEGQPFVADPSNRNPVFERARLRLDGGVERAETERIIAATQDFGRRRVAREERLDDLLARNVALHPAGFAVLQPAALAGTPGEDAGEDADEDERLAEALLGRVAACIGAAGYPIRRERLARLHAALRNEPQRARTLGGCRFVPWRGVVIVMRELANAALPLSLPPEACVLWDGRFQVEPRGIPAADLMLGYLGQAPAGLLARAGAGRDGGDLPRFLWPTLPAFWDAAGLAGVAALGYRRPDLDALPDLSFRPANPLTRWRFTVVSSKAHPMSCWFGSSACDDRGDAPRA